MLPSKISRSSNHVYVTRVRNQTHPTPENEVSPIVSERLDNISRIASAVTPVHSGQVWRQETIRIIEPSKTKKVFPRRQICLILLGGGIIAAILASISGIALAVALPKVGGTTSTTTTSTTSTSTSSTSSTTTSTTTTTTRTTTTTATTTTTTTTTQPTTTTTTSSSTSTSTTTATTTTSTSTTTTTSTSTTTTTSTSTTTTTSTSTTSTTSTSTTSTTSTTATTTTCSNAGLGTIGLLTGFASNAWTNYSYTFTAAKTNYFLIFGFEAAVNRSWILDDVSVMETSGPGVELLSNPSFEASATFATSWVQWCSSYCHYGTSGTVITGADCFLSTGNCYSNACLGPAVNFLGQAISTTINLNYTISFELIVTGIGGYFDTMFYVDLY